MRCVMVLLGLIAMLALAAAPASAYNAPGPRWPGKTIRFHETLPKSWNWGIRQAVKTWNTSGINVRFVKVPRSRAQVKIGYGDANGSGGYASIGRQPGAYVEMNKSMYRPLRPEVRLVTAQILAHELGHVLGLDHVFSNGCRLMTPTVLGNCPDPPQPWLYDCSWLSKDDFRGALKLYGGKARKPARKWCPLEPKPPAPQDVRFISGDPVRIQWSATKSLRAGSVAVIEIFEEGRCRGESSSALLDTTYEEVRPGQWADYDYREPGTYCYEIHFENQYGQPSAAVQGIATYAIAPPARPVLQSLTEYPDDYSDYLADVAVPEGATLHVDVSPSGQCSTTPQEYSIADQLTETTWLLWGIPEGPSCLSFFAVDRVPSAPLTVEVVHGPRPGGP